MRLSGQAAIHDAVSGARLFADRNGIPEDAATKLAIVVEELVTNLYEHGGLADSDLIDIELTVEAASIRLAITDHARPFDPRSAVQGHVPSRGGNAGLALVRNWASAIDYRSSGGTNRLTLALPL